MGFGQWEYPENRGIRPDAPLSDQAMVQHARALALSLTVEGEARARVQSGLPLTLKRISREARRLQVSGVPMTPAMEWLADNIRMVETMSSHLTREKHVPLPAKCDQPRMQILMRELALHADAQISRARLCLTLAAFDELQGLWMDEIWCAPQLLKMELCATFALVARRVIAAQRDRYAAEQWVLGGANTALIGKKHASGAFYERALKLMHEQDMPGGRRALEEWLIRRDTSAEQVILREHETQALDRLYLSNIITSLNTLDALNWTDCFLEISRTEHALLEDPSGIYKNMDEPSRALLRGEVHHIARRTGLGELAVARAAVKLAAEADGFACHYLYDDDGRRALLSALKRQHARLSPIAPDPGGRMYMALILLMTALFECAFSAGVRSIALSVIALPIAWSAASMILNAVITRVRAPRRLLKLRLKSVPAALRTLVVIPALLSNRERALELCAQLEAHGCLESDENIDFLLLGDFRDHDEGAAEDDEDILLAARAQTERMNARAERKKYYYLHRPRTFSEESKRYMGHERKRGALMALNALLLRGESAFSITEDDADALARRYKYVVTLDADTRMLPGTVNSLVAALAHPQNRRREEGGRVKGYSILQPRMELSKRAVQSPFVALFGGEGGVDSYPAAVSDVFQDFTGGGIYGGKGIYDIEAFDRQIEGKLPDAALVCHDLIEGALAGVGFLSDVTLYDGFPLTLTAYLKRMERWTRGDWQLLPFMLGRLQISPLSRYFMLANLLRSLATPASLVLIVLGVWFGTAQAILIALAPHVLPAILSLPHLKMRMLRGVAAHICLLPATSRTLAWAILRALHRLKTRKNMLEWVTAADADRMKEENLELYGRIAAILLLPGILRLDMAIAAIGFAALFLVGTSWVREMQSPFEKKRLSDQHADLLMRLARETWHFFETFVPADGHNLPPDNVQLDPPVGVAERTSPTNIGLYLIACLSAERLGLIDSDAFVARVERTLNTLESLETWNGQLYNWYDTGTLAPLTPKYVSTVDGGNLAACLLALSSALRERSAALADRLEALARGMAFETLYDEDRHLFLIGYDAENDRPSKAHYDLLASEARILSYAAIMLKKTDVKNFKHLGRASVKTAGGQALLSWSGTMFEYLMPELFMRAPRGSIIERTNEAVVKAQIQFAEGEDMPWGVSESGYHAFDMQMNYQYRAFGLSALSLRSAPDKRVISPYASMLALAVDPQAAAKNLGDFYKRGFFSEYGLYEAIDYEGKPRAVISHMAHHQGMIMAALLNALRDGALTRAFMSRPEAEAVSLLLEEREAPTAMLTHQICSEEIPKKHAHDAHYGARALHPDALFPDTHLLYGGGATYFACANGAGFLRANGLMVNRFFEDPMRPDGIFLHVRTGSEAFCLTGQRSLPDTVSFRAAANAGFLQYTARSGALSAGAHVSVSPEDGTLLMRVHLTNCSARPLDVEVTNCFAVALAAQPDMKAHPAFHGLFVESALVDERALIFSRRPQDEREFPMLLHRAGGVDVSELSYETDLGALIGREGDLSRADGISDKFSMALGAVLNPCSALRAKITLAPGAKRSIYFAISINKKDCVEAALRRPLNEDAAERSEQLASTQARAMLEFLKISPVAYPLLCRAAAYMMYPRLPNALRTPAPGALNVSGLWAIGVSGDLPIIAVSISSMDQIDLVREVIHAHEFFRTQGAWSDLLLINEYGNDYEQPIRDAVRELISASHLRELTCEPGGAFVLDGAALTEPQRALIFSMASLIFSGGRGALAAQLRAQLGARSDISAPALREMAAGRAQGPLKRLKFNGYGGFSEDGERYIIDLAPGKATPAPWCNVLANEHFGTLISERGGAFTWHGNSRNGRLTPFLNDILCEGFGEAAYVVDPEEKCFAELFPGPGPLSRAFRVVHAPGETTFEAASSDLSWTVTTFVDKSRPIKCVSIALENHSAAERTLTLTYYIDWLMGIMPEDARFLSLESDGDTLYARGQLHGLGFACLPGGTCRARSRAEFLGARGVRAPSGLATPGMAALPGDACAVLQRTLKLKPGETARAEIIIGFSPDVSDAKHLLSDFLKDGAAARLESAKAAWRARLSRIGIQTPDIAMNAMVNRFLPYQVLSSRVFGRTGLYQSGGAFGFRDQLQDMLSLIPIEPALARAHILNCAAHQFESGDVMHWWHPERTGVRTRISDDLLFLPYVAANYALETGDFDILGERANYLCDIEIPEAREDFYGTPSVSPISETLHEHCMRAFRRAHRLGENGLPLMGTGDWNDGMNRVGQSGRGESVWLAEFMIATARLYARVSTNADDAAQLESLADSLTASVEKNGYSGEWYYRAFMDDGRILGSRENGEHGCRIDAIAQSWAVMAGLKEDRARRAMDEVDRQLIARDIGIIKLLTPPFDSPALDPGYIKGYVPGIRENGGQYTHAACWVVMAFARLGDAERAWEAFRMLMPYSHADTPEKAARYRVEPYVVCADVYGEPPNEGRGGWTWYTGAAAWLCRVAITELLGFKRTGDRASMASLLPKNWNELALTLEVGKSRYTLISRRTAQGVVLDGHAVTGGDITLKDDAADHIAVFPARK